MKLLYANDERGAYPNSWYTASATPLSPFPELRGEVHADVCVIGGGFTGLSAALHLAQFGFDVVLVEAHRVGFGASGRNGGQVGSGMRKDQDELEAKYGHDVARQLWQLGEDAKSLVKDLITEHQINAVWRNGIAHAAWTAAGAAEEQAYAAKLQKEYGYDQVQPLSQSEMREIIGSDGFKGGLIDWGAGHIHPLRFAFGLARAAAEAGVRIYEMSAVHDLRGIVRTDHGRVKADHVVLATNGYHDRLHPKVASRVLPINNFVIASEPLGDRATEVLSKDIAVADSKFVVNYWRISEDQRLLFGGSESYGDKFPDDIVAAVRKPMLEIYPHLADVQIDYAWGGTLAITPTRMPDIARIAPNLWSAAGYSGHGVALATLTGKLIARAIGGDSAGFDLLGKVRPPAFPGVGLFRRPLLNLAMRWAALQDRFQR